MPERFYDFVLSTRFQASRFHFHAALAAKRRIKRADITAIRRRNGFVSDFRHRTRPGLRASFFRQKNTSRTLLLPRFGP